MIEDNQQELNQELNTEVIAQETEEALLDAPVGDAPQDSGASCSYIRGVVESLLFVSERPVTVEQFKKVLGAVSAADIKKVIETLRQEYEQKNAGMTIREIAGGYQMLTNPSYAQYIRNFYKTKHKEKLSKPALETLAIVAYKQPVTRLDIELIRGVNSDGVVTHLLEKELIKVVGRKDVPGKPYLYGTTKQFLEYFGLKSLEDLPRLEEFPSLYPAEKNSSAPPEDSSESALKENADANLSENRQGDASTSE